MNNSINRMRIEDVRSERRIIKNKIRRQREMRKNFLIFVMTVCLIVTFSLTCSAFRANAKEDSDAVSYKYYKSIAINRDDTLWSIAEKYMDEDHYDSAEDYIREVKDMNSLQDDVIHYGEYLVIPYYTNQFTG